MRIYLVRHGISIGNEDRKTHLVTPDHAIGLADAGPTQARISGKKLAEDFRKRDLPGNGHIRLWHGPYKRHRQTADEIEKTCVLPSGCPWIDSRKEHLLLAEQDFGLFNGLSHGEKWEQYPKEMEHYERCLKEQGRIWARMPAGESGFDVCARQQLMFGTFHRDCEKHGIENIVVVGSGLQHKAFMLMWLHHPYEFMDTEPNPNNCSIRLLEDNVDRGYIFDGFK